MKEKIAKAMMELMKTYRYRDLKIQTICDATPVSRNVFYYYFNSKQDLLEWICIWNYQKYCLPYHYDTGNSQSLFKYILRYRGFYSAIYKIDEGILLYNCLKKAHMSGTSIECVEEYTTLKKGTWRKINKDVYVHYATSGIAAVLTYWVASGYKQSVDEIAEDLTIMLTEPLTEIRDKYVY